MPITAKVAPVDDPNFDLTMPQFDDPLAAVDDREPRTGRV